MTPNRKPEAESVEVEAEAYLSAPYVRMLVPDAEEGGFVAEVLELPGCISQGETAEEAYENLQDAMSGWIAASLDHKKPIPEPVGEKEYSGHFPLRMSTELHRVAALRAAYEGVSLNQWIARAITEQVAGQEIADRVASKVAQQLLDAGLGGLRPEGLPSAAPDPQGLAGPELQEIREGRPRAKSYDASSPPLAEEDRTDEPRDA